jgi:hypothetical protein
VEETTAHRIVGGDAASPADVLLFDLPV